MARGVKGITWGRSESIKLGKAVASFNRALKGLEGKGISLPNSVDFKNLKEDITTNKELIRVVNALNRFTKPSQQVGVSINGVMVTQWELSEVKKARNRAVKRLSGELNELKSVSTFGTGNKQLNEINALLNSYEGLFDKKDFSSYRRTQESIMRQGRLDFDYRKAKIFQENFIEAYTKMGREEIVEFAKSYKDPERFWKAIKESELVDLKFRYDVEEGTIRLEMTSDDSYYYELMKLGIEL